MKYIIKRSEEKLISYLLDDNSHAVEIRADAPAAGPAVGDIYIGRVDRVLKNIQAAFVDVIPGVSGYLGFDDIVEPIYTKKGPSPDIQPGDELVVQISREAFGSKDMALTTKLSFRGKYSVMTIGGVGLGVSKKLSHEQRDSFKKELLSNDDFKRFQKESGGAGVTVRTAAGELGEDTAKKTILTELERLKAEIVKLRLTAPYRAAYTAMIKQPPKWIRRIERYTDQVSQILTDDESVFRRLKEYFDSDAGTLSKLRLYQDSMVPMEKLFSLERELERATRKRVDLKSGADLVIETTEALHVIDVNSGRSRDGKNKEEAILKVNLEAAAECARQMRLRNLSGIIVIDFINMKEYRNNLKVMEELRRCSAADPCRTSVVELTKLGLVEVTRRKVDVPLAMQLR